MSSGFAQASFFWRKLTPCHLMTPTRYVCGCSDYAANPELDEYDPTLLDDAPNVSELSVAERRHVDQVLDVRDRIQAADRLPSRGRVGRLAEGLQDVLIAEGGTFSLRMQTHSLY